jgi:hypothetical protein
MKGIRTYPVIWLSGVFAFWLTTQSVLANGKEQNLLGMPENLFSTTKYLFGISENLLATTEHLLGISKNLFGISENHFGISAETSMSRRDDMTHHHGYKDSARTVPAPGDSLPFACLSPHADFEYATSEAWLASDNAAGLQHLPAAKISLAEVYFNKGDGEYINFHRSNDSREWGASVKSYYRLSPRVVFYGQISYADFQGRNMGGSVFIDPQQQGLDIVEYADTLAGTKRLERYHLTGAVGVQLSHRLTLGGKVNYRAANYAKFKDLRHTNSFFDMSVTAGLSYRFGKMAEAGANWFYRRNVESLRLDIYGTTDKQYTSLVSFGAFYGRTELFGEDGYTGESTITPDINTYNGGSVQLNLTLSDRTTFFNELSFRQREGYYGKRSTTSVVYAGYGGDELSWAGALSFGNRRLRHQSKVNADRRMLETFENVYRKENLGGGRMNVVYYGKNKMLDRNTLHLRLTHTAWLDVAGDCPAWTFTATAEAYRRRQTVSIYPFYRRQTVRSLNAGISAERNIACGSGTLGVRAGVAYGSGGGVMKNDGVYAPVPPEQRPPKSSESNLLHEYEYLTATRAGGSVGCKYAFPVAFAGNLYFRADCELSCATKGYFRHQKYFSPTLAAGCSF